MSILSTASVTDPPLANYAQQDGFQRHKIKKKIKKILREIVYYFWGKIANSKAIVFYKFSLGNLFAMVQGPL